MANRTSKACRAFPLQLHRPAQSFQRLECNALAGTLIASHVPYTVVDRMQRKRLFALPMFHAATAPLAHFSALRCGDICYVMNRFEFEPYLRNIEKYQITEGAFVPPMVHMIISSPLAQKYSLKSIRLAHAGAAPLDKGSQARLKPLLHDDTTLTQVWGSVTYVNSCS